MPGKTLPCLHLLKAAALFLIVITTAASLSAAARPNNYIYPTLAADGVTSDDVALAKAAAACDAGGARLVLPLEKFS